MDDQPAILVYVQEGTASDAVRDILLGIEEEGVPYQVTVFPESRADCLAHQAALDSRLDVGIGYALDGFCSLHHAKLILERPVLKLRGRRSDLRSLGSNSARLVKGIPMIFKGETHEGSTGLD